MKTVASKTVYISTEERTVTIHAKSQQQKDLSTVA
jgi:hypothetical protein